MNLPRMEWTNERVTIPKGWIIHNMNGDLEDNRLENLACIPRKTGNISEVVAPYRARIKDLELQLREENK